MAETPHKDRRDQINSNNGAVRVSKARTRVSKGRKKTVNATNDQRKASLGKQAWEITQGHL